MPTKTLLEVAPFQYVLFLALFVSTFLLNVSGTISKSISFAIRQMAKEAKRAGRHEIHEELLASAEAQPSGRIVGLLETTLYLYALVTQIHGLITAVILFKAFSGWLSPKPGQPGKETQSPRTLARYYTYALGNLMSLLWSIVLFEFARYLVSNVGWIHNFVWVQ